jgi:hypothetical protein
MASQEPISTNAFIASFKEFMDKAVEQVPEGVPAGNYQPPGARRVVIKSAGICRTQ